ncbi:MAG: hypothetical protein ACK2T2_13220 [Anaerolineales bacterium]|jgi:FlaG/FlaF family flagellin (archaellin)
MKNVLRPRSFGMLIIALILAASIYGFANSNTMPAASYAGDGSTAISGYTVSAVSYDIYGDNDPIDIDGISFTLNAAAGQVYVSFDGGTTWEDCSPGTPSSSINCTLGTPISVLSATQLRIIAAD